MICQRCKKSYPRRGGRFCGACMPTDKPPAHGLTYAGIPLEWDKVKTSGGRRDVYLIYLPFKIVKAKKKTGKK